MLPLTAFLAFVLAVGPSLQQVAVATLDSTAKDAYSAVYDNAIAPTVSISHWLLSGLHPANLLLAFAVAITAVSYAATSRQLLKAVWVCTAVYYTISDVIWALALDSFALGSMVTNILANTLGGGVVAGLLAMAIPLVRISTRLLAVPPRASGRIGGIFIASIGLLISTFAFMVQRQVFQPVQLVIQLSSAAPFSGYYWASRETPAEEKFDFLSSQADEHRIDFTSTDGQLEVDWARTGTRGAYDLTVRAFSDCAFRWPEDLPHQTPLMRVKEISTLRASVNPGLTTVKIGDEGLKKSHFALKSVTFFWVNPNKTKSEALDISHFASSEDRLETKILDQADIILSVPLVEAGEGSVRSSSRSIRLEINGEVWDLLAEPIPNTRDGDKLVCRAMGLPPSNRTDGTRNQWDINATPARTISLLLSLRARPDTEYYPDATSTLTITGDAGDAEIVGVTKDGLYRSEPKDLRHLNLSGSDTALVLGGEKVELGPEDSISLNGDLSARYNKNGALVVTGKTSAAWKNTERLSKTPWERLSTEWQISIVTAILAFLLAAVRWTWLHRADLLTWNLRDWD